jgi:MerR family Zn(II)-responsive transcriptional regulator of zntA
MRDGMRIGELAVRFGLNPKTLRYYEEIGLLPRADRSDSGYRLYDEQDAERLGFIRRAKTLGLSLDEIRDILSVQAEGEPPCGQVLGLIDRKISAINRRMAELQEFRAELATLRAAWTDEDERVRYAAPPACICPIIEQQTEVEDHPHAVQEFEPALHR